MKLRELYGKCGLDWIDLFMIFVLAPIAGAAMFIFFMSVTHQS